MTVRRTVSTPEAVRHGHRPVSRTLADGRPGIGRRRVQALDRRLPRHGRAERRLRRHLRPRLCRGVTDVDPEVLEKARYQPEFTAPVWDYFDNRVHEQSVAVGRDMARKWKPWLDKIEARFGVDRNILLAIWSMESNYGEILKNDKVMRNVVRSLATLAYADKKRAKFARTQLVAALKILQTGDIDESHLMGSWAGAMGHTQFIPTSYQAYAVDMDGNGHRDIWNSMPDALATAANLLTQERLADRQDLGLRSRAARRRQVPQRLDEPCQVAGPRRVERANGKAFRNAWRQGRAEGSGRPQRVRPS